MSPEEETAAQKPATRPRRAAAGREARPAAPPQTANVLALHGGGFMGFFAAHVLATLAQRKVSELRRRDPLGASFDIVAGTSVGAILAAAIAVDVDPGEVVALMARRGEEIFPRRFLMRNKPGLFGARFSSWPLRRVIEQVLGDIRLGDVARPLVIPAIDETDGRAVVFRSHDPSQADVPLVEAVLASAAAPTYLPLHRFRKRRYADGGLIANGPELVAAIDLMARFGVPIGRQHVLSIGTTRFSAASPTAHWSDPNWGVLDWLLRRERLLPLLMAAQIDLQRQLLGDLRPAAFLHFDIELNPRHEGKVHLVRADPAAQAILAEAAEAAVADLAGDDLAALDVMLLRQAWTLRRHGPHAPPSLEP